jgi:glycosyltransferase involved in cell wall biosynthesis
VGLAGALLELDDVDPVGIAARHRHPPVVEVPIPVRQLPWPRLVLYESWHRLRWPRAEGAAGRVDVVHATGGAVPGHRAPLVVTIHDLAWHHEPAHFTRRGVAFHRRALALALAEAAALVVPSEATRVDVVEAGADPGRVRVIPWGVEQRAGDPERARRHFDLPDQYLLFVGTIEPRKNLPRLLDAVARLGPSAPPLVMVGPRGWHEDVDHRLSALPVRPVPLGFVETARLPDLYAAATVVCYPSLREGFGLPVLEAMAQGAPVVTSTGTSTEEVAGSAAVVVDPTDVGAIADGIAGLLADPERARALGEAGRRRAAEFTWSRCAVSHRDIYREVA